MLKHFDLRTLFQFMREFHFLVVTCLTAIIFKKIITMFSIYPFIYKYIFIYKFFYLHLSHLFKTTILFIIFWDFLMFYQIFYSPQVKRMMIISNKHGIYELPNDLRRRILEIRKYQEDLKTS